MKTVSRVGSPSVSGLSTGSELVSETLLCFEPSQLMRRSRLTILCQNVAGHYFSKNDPPRLKARLEFIAEQVANRQPDIVCIQELYTVSAVWPLNYASHKNFFLERLSDLGYEAISGKTGWIGMDSGLVLLAKQKLLLTLLEFNYFDAQVIGGSKGYLAGQVKIDGKLLAIIDCHLWWTDTVVHKQRSQLAKAIRQFVDSNRATHFVICGDMNDSTRTCPTSHPDPDLAFSECVACQLGHEHTYPNDQVSYDHFFVRGPLQPVGVELIKWQLDDGLPISDHYGLSLTIELT